MTRGAAEVVVASLSKRFGGGGVLDGIDLVVRGGALSVIVGPPGSGKSTLVRCLTGVYRADSGAISYRLGSRGAVDLAASDARTVAWMRTHHISSFDGALPAAPRLATAVAAARAARCSRPAAVAALNRLHVSALAQVPIGRLRTPERLTVALAAALLAERPFVFLDEPEQFADATRLSRWLRRLTDGGAAVVVTGRPGSALESTASARGRLERGRIEWHTR